MRARRLPPPPLPLPLEALGPCRLAPRGRVQPARQLRLGARLAECLAREAAQRGLSAEALGRRLLTAVLADGLIDAVLDDEARK